MMKSLLSTLLLLSALSVNALPAALAPLTSSEIASKSATGLRLIELEEGVQPVWKTEREILDYITAGTNFFDVTDTYEVYQKLEATSRKAKAAGDVARAAYPTPRYQTAVRAILATMGTANMQSWLTTLTGYNNRYYTSTTGVNASNWIRTTAQNIANQYSRSDVQVSLFTHSWAQPSIIARIPGSDPSLPRVLLGAHMDSINSASPANGRAAGADDDGTGTVNLLEAYRALLQGNFRPRATVEFQWYAAEEVGLRGSQAIATQYRDTGVQVAGHFQLDMTGYFRPGSREVMALAPDYINTELNEYSKAIITAYSRIPWANDRPCGYACSDHASFYRVGFPTTYPFEAVTGDDNPNIHSSSDTTSVRGFDWNHSLEFAKVAAAWAYELAM